MDPPYAVDGSLGLFTADPSEPLWWESFPMGPAGACHVVVPGRAVAGLRVAAGFPFRLRVDIGGACVIADDRPDGQTWTWIAAPLGEPASRTTCPLLAAVAPLVVTVAPLVDGEVGSAQVFAACTDDERVTPPTFPFTTPGPRGGQLTYVGRDRPCVFEKE